MLNLITLLLLPLFGTINSASFPEVLTPEEEKEYLSRWEQKDMDARNALIEHNLRLVAHIVKKFENTKECRDDLLSIGAFGLIKAVDTYRFGSETKLATYASRCIENEILMHLRNNKKRKDTSSLYAPIGEDKDGNEIHLCDIIEDPSPSIIDQLVLNEHNERLHEALAILDEREFDIIKRRYGFCNQPVETQREIAKSMKISRSYVSRIEKRALTKLYLYLKG
jgi:RNA polymerase sporulation-specific sigma factor